VKTIVNFFTSETFGFLLKLFSGFAAAAFGMLGIGTKTRNDDGSLTGNGWIALVGIIVAGVLAIGTSIYEFTTTATKAKVAQAQSEQLLLAVRRGIYPLKGIMADVTYRLGRDAPYLKAYVELLRKKLPRNHITCKDTKSYTCGDLEPDKTFTYEITSASPLYPKDGTKAQAFIDGLGVRVVMIRMTPDKSAVVPRNTIARSFYFVAHNYAPAPPPIVGETMASGPTITFHPANGQLDLSIEQIAVPDSAVTQSGVYSLVDVFPGFVAIQATALAGNRGECDFCVMPGKAAQRDIAVITSLSLRFPYPKALGIDEDDTDFECSAKKTGDFQVIMLPDDIDALSEKGSRFVDKPETHKDSVCAILAQRL
jgi:hypothetical protein